MSWSFYWSSQPLNWCQASFVASCSQPDSCVAVCDCLSARRWRVRKERIKSQTLDAAADTTHPSDQFVAGCISASIHPRNPVWMILGITSQSRPTCFMFMFLPHPFKTSLEFTRYLNSPWTAPPNSQASSPVPCGPASAAGLPPPLGRKRRPPARPSGPPGTWWWRASQHPRPAAEAVAGVAVQTWATNREWEFMGIHVDVCWCLLGADFDGDVGWSMW